MNRRQFFKTAAGAAVTGWLSSGAGSLAAELDGATQSAKAQAGPAVSSERYKIGVCDWMLLKRQKVGAFPLAGEIGVDGVEVDMGGLGNRPTFDNHLADAKIRRQFLEAACRFGLEICSLAMSGFYAQSFAGRGTVPQMLQDCLATMTAMNVKIAFLPLGVPCDLARHPDLRPAVVARLKAVAPKAEAAGVVIGIETALDAAGEAQLLEDIGSPAIRSYFNFSNALQNGRDLMAELRTLGRERICQIHCTDQDGVWLQNDPKIDMPRVRRTLDDLRWRGWLVMERSRSARNPRNVKWNFGANAAYLKSIFQAK
ncbi:MAG: sugar phosphate isomerase/epimerase [Verrucomicrobiota bacterium]|nr:sugar phosphate isomerase/epimerase [Verrucomicrobiota bacterium]